MEKFHRVIDDPEYVDIRYDGEKFNITGNRNEPLELTLNSRYLIRVDGGAFYFCNREGKHMDGTPDPVINGTFLFTASDQHPKRFYYKSLFSDKIQGEVKIVDGTFRRTFSDSSEVSRRYFR